VTIIDDKHDFSFFTNITPAGGTRFAKKYTSSALSDGSLKWPVLAQASSATIRSPGVDQVWDPCALVAALCVNVGSLAETVMVMEKKRHPREGASVHLAQNIAGTLYALTELSTAYEIDLERAWNETMQSGWLKLAKLEDRERDEKND
jgi:hypothetical protein